MTLQDYFNESYIPEPNSGCWLWIGHAHPTGYGLIHYNSKQIRAHRLSWEFYKGKILNNLWVLHHCDTPLCVNPDHLFLGTHQDNMKDKISKGRQAKGEQNGYVKLTTADVIFIRRSDLSLRKLGALFNVAYQTVGHIKARHKWRHVE